MRISILLLGMLVYCLGFGLETPSLQKTPACFAAEAAAETATAAAAKTRTKTKTFPLQSRRILFLGDSITHSGLYISLLETQLRLQGVEPLPELLNLGLSSETCSGLSEPEHPFPRPNVQDRIDRALELIQPDVVVACYGMNDGIYHPFAEQRFQAYQQGIRQIVEKSRAAGAKVILLAPPPFDPLLPGKNGKLKPAGAENYAYFAMYKNYDEVLKKYGDWILQQQELADLVIDLHQPLAEYVQEQRKQNPEFTVTPDGIHPNPTGHRLMAAAILKAWGIENWQEPESALVNKVHQKTQLLHAAWLSHVGHKRPDVKPGLPIPEAQQKAAELTREITELTATRQ